MQTYIIKLSRRVKQFIVGAVDALISVAATWMAFYLRLDSADFPHGYQWHAYQLAIILSLPILMRFGLYRAVFRYTGMAAMATIVKAIALYGAIFFTILVWLALPGVPRTLGLIQPILFLFMVAGSRAFARIWLTRTTGNRRFEREARLLIYGAGAAGAQIAEVIQRKRQLNLIGFLDDDPQLVGKTINAYKVHCLADLPHMIELYSVTDILLAMPTISRSRRNEVLAVLRQYHVRIRSLPDLSELAQGKATIADIHELDIVDLLGREPVAPNPALISRNILGKVILVTGAGGSVGSELCRQIIAARPAKLLLLEHNEFSLYQIHSDLIALAAELNAPVELIQLLGSVRDYERILEVCTVWKPHTVYHAAAYKHVPLVEYNAAEGVRNNVFGTYNVARAAVESGVADFVLISTDKAVRPTNIMGASKRLAEMILQALATSAAPTFENAPAGAGPVSCRTRFAMVRFGNVLDSSGSVVPLFRQQIKEGGPVTVTDLEVTRYFMTIPEAAQLVVQAGAMTEGGDVFVLDMGAPVKIIDLAYRMIELSGLLVKDDNNPFGDIEIKVTGLRPGEKLYEELLIGENPQATAHPRIMKAQEDFLPWEVLSSELQLLARAVEGNQVEVIRTILERLVIGYLAHPELVDLVYLKENAALV
ncbi:MAG: capD [Herbaspirillum sp.]|nr:capD [Herbaspirillum sp.]